jgi:hypothetical protein
VQFSIVFNIEKLHFLQLTLSNSHKMMQLNIIMSKLFPSVSATNVLFSAPNVLFSAGIGTDF